MVTVQLNGRAVGLYSPSETPLLWVLRHEAGLPGTKYGCGVGVCGVCTVHLDGQAAKACQVTLAEVGGRAVTTIEGLAARGHPVIDAWVAERVPQSIHADPALGLGLDADGLVARSRIGAE